ncbi:DUF4260 domain-containing protein [Croceitalea rosinachiae]|uniref:DUF4260 domain-containing protein n=1 Tax=Croceitalea rosinachiae TaxID=3075596 RepID=A0ABU3A7C7_9FLAO|nr:DUF4260 domain-containing protein [Croceitalea sp. F388]MDT0605808.1 DUF4260 domain-containing protein [Croceitalea sp. F388]
MKNNIRLEEFMLLLLGFFLFMEMDFEWWLFFALLIVPDIGMLGYLGGNKIGAFLYNLFHHRGLAIFLLLVGKSFLNLPWLELIGIIMFSHIAMDRVFGYGLKYDKGFKYTHLGEIGNKNG